MSNRTITTRVGPMLSKLIELEIEPQSGTQSDWIREALRKRVDQAKGTDPSGSSSAQRPAPRARRES